MECVYCYNHVRVVDTWEGYKVVECAACEVRYDVSEHQEQQEKGEK